MKPIAWYKHHNRDIIGCWELSIYIGPHWVGVTIQWGLRELRLGIYMPKKDVDKYENSGHRERLRRSRGD